MNVRLLRLSLMSGLPLVVALVVFSALAEEPSNPANSVRPATPQPLTERTPWTTSRVHGTPEAPPPYRTEVAFPKLAFESPLEVVAGPDPNRMTVVERYGKVYSFVTSADVAEAQLLLDVGHTTYGFAYHPKFAENGYVYVTYVVDPNEPSEDGTRLARFQATGPERLQCDPASEKILLTWPSGGHNGGCLRFGPDGLLYIATGDGSGIADSRETGQDISDLLGSILRIDVDRTQGRRSYAIPADNPFVAHAGARPEVYAYGLRQVWRFSFDRPSGDLWAGEVGQDLWEMIYRIERGGNYGWSVQEGRHPFRPQRKLGPSPILPPVIEHSHTDFRSITGGYVYHGKRLPELRQEYIYGDYDTGRVWAFRYQDGEARQHRELADTPLRIVAFGEDAEGELYLLDFMGGQLHRLVKAPPSTAHRNFPRKLSQTGLFSSVPDHEPAPGVIPYSVNAPLWSDGAEKERFIAIPGDAQIEFETVTYPQPAPGSTPGWRFPSGTVAVKTFSIEEQVGETTRLRRIETRLLHIERTPGTEEVGDQYWQGYSYLWNDEQTDAELLPASGADREYTVADVQNPGGGRTLRWHFPSRAECTLCHTTPAKYVLGLNTAQMNRLHDYGGVKENQLVVFERLGLFTKPLPKRPEEMPRLYDYHNTQFSLEDRARSYLDANCSHCHRKWGGGNAEFQLLSTLPLAELGIVQTRPQHGDFKVPNAQLLAPGSPETSLILHRMQIQGLGRMPHIASGVVDTQAVQMLKEWISQLKPQAGE